MFRDNIWAAYLADVGSLKNKRPKKVLNGFIGIVNESKHKQINYGLIKEKNFTIALCKCH